MAADDLEVASQFRVALEAAAKTGDRSAVYPMLASDVEWVAPQRTLHGIDEVREDMIWGFPPDQLDIEFELGSLEDPGDGRIAFGVHEIYRMKGTGDFAYERDRRIELTIRDGKISRHEMKIIR